MSRALVLGRGQMGRSIARCMHILGNDVATFDVDPPGYDIDGVTHNIMGDVKSTKFPQYLDDYNPHIVISALPYFLNAAVADHCIDRKIRYCDLGGHVETSKYINRQAKKRKSMVFTDLGLAPGLVNILAIQAYNQGGNPDTIEMFCGGLPEKHGLNPLNYLPTWSIDGLYNEYKDDCLVLEDGEIVSKRALDGFCNLKFSSSSLGIVEAFYTSGGASHSLEYFQNKGVLNCSYKTLRYTGHRQLVKWLIENLDKESCNKLFRSCDHSNERDIVIIAIHATGGKKLFDTITERTFIIRATHDETAMQRATAYPCAVIANLMTQLKMDRPLTYEATEIFFDTINEDLKSLGINLEE